MSTTNAIESKLASILYADFTIDQALEELGLISRAIEYCETNWECPKPLAQRLIPIFQSSIPVARGYGWETTALDFEESIATLKGTL